MYAANLLICFKLFKISSFLVIFNLDGMAIECGEGTADQNLVLDAMHYSHNIMV